MEQTVRQYSYMFREIEAEIGTRDLCSLVIKSLKDTVRNFHGTTIEDFMHQMGHILAIVNSTEPRFAIIIDTMYRFLDEIHDAVPDDGKHKHACQEYRKKMLDILDTILQNSKQELERMLTQARNLDMKNKTILIHDHSHSVQDALHAIAESKQMFNVIIAEQDAEKTHGNIETLTENGIPFVVVPSYMISNIEEEVDAFFFGALTLKSTYDFVVDTGTSAIISHCHLRNIPTYGFLTTSKFALWEATNKEQIHHHRHKRKHPLSDIEFERLKFSHDRVPLSSVDHIVTEQGIFANRDIKDIYDQRLKKRLKQQERYGKA